MVPEEFDTLDDTWKFIVKKMKRDFDKNKQIPAEVFERYVRAQSEAEHFWEEAKNKSDYSIFAPKLKEIIELTKEITGYTDPDKEIYDALLNQYEEGMDSVTIDKIFGELKEELVPLIAQYDGMLKEQVEKELGDIDTIMEVCGREVTAQPLSQYFKEKYPLK